MQNIYKALSKNVELTTTWNIFVQIFSPSELLLIFRQQQWPQQLSRSDNKPRGEEEPGALRFLDYSDSQISIHNWYKCNFRYMLRQIRQITHHQVGMITQFGPKAEIALSAHRLITMHAVYQSRGTLMCKKYWSGSNKIVNTPYSCLSTES